ncbi:MAG: DUF4169 family protein [Alphaproteobacteria bacterium]|nr:DUF4169 family protein [Alphaproteobacteria bacterium]
MGDIVNLNRERKLRRRTEANGAATANRAKHGLPKIERLRQLKKSERDAKHLADKKIDRD